MAIVFYVIGWLVILIGAFITVSSIAAVSRQLQFAGSSVDALVNIWLGTAIATGLGIMLSGLLLLAIGGVLSRLDRIAQNTAHPTVLR